MPSIEKHINIEGVLKALENHIIHGAEMSSTQVNAALTLIKKAFPDSKPEKTKEDVTIIHENALKALISDQ